MYNTASIGFALMLVIIGLIIRPIFKGLAEKFKDGYKDDSK